MNKFKFLILTMAFLNVVLTWAADSESIPEGCLGLNCPGGEDFWEKCPGPACPADRSNIIEGGNPLIERGKQLELIEKERELLERERKILEFEHQFR